MGWAARANDSAATRRMAGSAKKAHVRGYRVGDHVRFRPLERRDVPTIYRWYDGDRRQFWNQKLDMVWFYALVDDRDAFAYAVLRGGFLAGFGLLRWHDETKTTLAPMVLVDPLQRGRKLGRAIVIELVTHVAAKLPQCTAVVAESFADNNAIVKMASDVRKMFGVGAPSKTMSPDGRSVLTWTLPIHRRKSTAPSMGGGR